MVGGNIYLQWCVFSGDIEGLHKHAGGIVYVYLCRIFCTVAVECEVSIAYCGV